MSIRIIWLKLKSENSDFVSILAKTGPKTLHKANLSAFDGRKPVEYSIYVNVNFPLNV